MAFSNRYALLDQTSLETISKLRSLPKQDQKTMVAALEAQDEADRAQDAEWLAEKAAKDGACAVDGAFALSADVRRMSWADECQAETEAATDAEADADVEAAEGCGNVTNHSSRAKKMNEKTGGLHGAVVVQNMIGDSDEEHSVPDATTADETDDDAGAVNNAVLSTTKTVATKRTPFPEWDDYIAGMPAVFAPAAVTSAPEPDSSASSSAAAPSYAAAATSEVNGWKSTTDTEVDDVVVLREEPREMKEEKQVETRATGAEIAPGAPSKSKKKRARKADKKAIAQQQKLAVVAESAAEVVAKPSVAPAPIDENIQATTIQPKNIGVFSDSPSQPVADSLVEATSSVEETQDVVDHIDIEKAPVDIGDTRPSPNTSIGSIEFFQEAVENPVIEIDNGTVTTAGHDAVSGEAEDISPEPVVPRKKKNRTRAQRRAAREVAAAAAAAEESGAAAHVPHLDAVVEVEKEEPVTKIEGKDEGMEIKGASQKMKPSGAQRRKAKKAAAAAIARTTGWPVGSYFLSWSYLLAVFMAQILVVVVSIYLMVWR